MCCVNRKVGKKGMGRQRVMLMNFMAFICICEVVEKAVDIHDNPCHMAWTVRKDNSRQWSIERAVMKDSEERQGSINASEDSSHYRQPWVPVMRISPVGSDEMDISQRTCYLIMA